jgi:MoxR-like ATPase
VFLIDELDRTDEAFEAFLLEVLSDYQVTIPEYGTIKAQERPIVIITTNRTREIHDALKRRCLYHWVDYPAADVELEIVARRRRDANKRCREEVVAYVQKLRQMDLFKVPRRGRDHRLGDGADRARQGSRSIRRRFPTRLERC